MSQEQGFGAFLTHHVSNRDIWELPFASIDLSQFHFWIEGVDMGLSLHVVMILLSAALLLVVLPRAARRQNHVPVSGFGHAIESLVLFLRDDFVIPFLGEQQGRRWMPYVLSLFFFLLTMDLIGLIPYMASPTGNINLTAALAFTTFMIFNTVGMHHNGVLHYFKNLVPAGTPWPVMILLYPIEIVGLVTKSAALSIRMFANLSAGHFVIFSLLGLIAVFKSYFVGVLLMGGALFVWCLELLVAFLQAYMFTLLSTLFIGGAIHQEH